MLNQRAIAAELGIAQTTVSRALRGSPLVRPETRRRIFKVAKRLGYQSNPMVSSLVEHTRSGRKARDQGCIALLIDSKSNATGISPHEAAELQCLGVSQRAALQGFRVERFHLQEKGGGPGKIDRILFSRGINALILTAPKSRLDFGPHFHWERYAAVTIGDDWDAFPVDRVSTDHRHNVRLAIQKLSELGYVRMGLVLPGAPPHPRDQFWLSSYLGHFYLLPRCRQIPVFTGRASSSSADEFCAWAKRWKPDILLTSTEEEARWLRSPGLRQPRDVPVVCLSRMPDSPLSGIDENHLHLGELACDLVVNHIIHNEYGPPRKPKLVLVNGHWRDGPKPFPRQRQQ